MINRFARPLIALGALTALAATSQATITFGGWPSGSLPSDIQQVGNGDVLIENPNLGSSNPLMSDANSVSYSESFAVTETAGTLIFADVDNVLSGVSDGTLTLSAFVNGNLIYTSTTTNFFLDGTETSLTVSHGIPLALGPGTYHALYTASYTGFDNGISYGYINSFNMLFQERSSTPEPASLATIGIGVVGLLARRRKGAK